MQKQTGSILLVASTCIGSGMIALPLLLAKLGLIPSVLLMLSTWALTYYTSLINLELNLQAGHGLSLGYLGQYFSGHRAKIIGTVSLFLLSYALLAVFIHGGSSVIQKLLDHPIDLKHITVIYSILAFLALLLPVKIIDYINRGLFVGLIGIVAVLVLALLWMIQWQDIPLSTVYVTDFNNWRRIIPVVFTSFGFQVIFHTLTNYCNNDAALLKKAFFWGSLIPAIVYIIWTSSVLSVIHQKNPAFYQQMITGKIDIGDLIKQLTHIAQWPALQLLIGWTSLLAIVTSVLGVGLGLCDSLKSSLKHFFPSSANRIMAAFITIAPAYSVAVAIPNAFITVLGFAGMILVIIAIILPIYLFFRMKTTGLHYTILTKRYLIWLSLLAGLGIALCEIGNIISR